MYGPLDDVVDLLLHQGFLLQSSRALCISWVDSGVFACIGGLPKPSGIRAGRMSGGHLNAYHCKVISVPDHVEWLVWLSYLRQRLALPDALPIELLRGDDSQTTPVVLTVCVCAMRQC